VDVPSEDRAWMAMRVVVAGLAHAVEAVGSEQALAAGQAQDCSMDMDDGDVVVMVVVVHALLRLGLDDALPVVREDAAVGSLADTRASRI